MSYKISSVNLLRRQIVSSPYLECYRSQFTIDGILIFRKTRDDSSCVGDQTTQN